VRIGAVFKRLLAYVVLNLSALSSVPSSSVADVPEHDKLLPSSGESLYTDCDFQKKKFSSLRPCLPFCDPVATSAQLSPQLAPLQWCQECCNSLQKQQTWGCAATSTTYLWVSSWFLAVEACTDFKQTPIGSWKSAKHGRICQSYRYQRNTDLLHRMFRRHFLKFVALYNFWFLTSTATYVIYSMVGRSISDI